MLRKVSDDATKEGYILIKYIVQGGTKLSGSVTISGAKNAAVAILPATLLVSGPCRIENVPDISDVRLLLEILRDMGAEIHRYGRNTLEIDCSRARNATAPIELVRRIRASYYLIGAELGRFGHAHVAMPGGCNFGVRPIDQHVKGFTTLGAEVVVEGGFIHASTENGRLKGANIYLDVVSVGATMNIMMAAVMAEGNTVIENAAKVGDALSTGSDLCTIYDLSYLEMTINVDELQVSSLSVGQTVQVTADAVQDRTYEGVVTRVSMKGDTSGGTTTYPVTVRIDETDGLRPGMNANAEIVVAQAKNALAVPNAAVVRGGYVLVTQDSPSAVNADPDMVAPDGFVYVKVKLGVSDSDYTQVVSGLTAQDTVGYDPSSVSSDTYYDNGGYEYMTDGTTDTTGGETTDGTADGEGAESTVTEEPAVDEPVDAGNDGEVIGEADGVILT